MPVDVPSPVKREELLSQAQRDVRPEEVSAQAGEEPSFGPRDQYPEEIALAPPTSATEVAPAPEEEHFELPLSEEDAWAMWQTLKQAQAIDTTQTQHLKVLSKPALAAPADVLAAHTWLVGQYQAHKAGRPIPRAAVVPPAPVVEPPPAVPVPPAPVVEPPPAVPVPPATPEPLVEPQPVEPAPPPPAPEVPPVEPVQTTPSVEQPPEPQPVPPPVEQPPEFNPFRPKPPVSPEPPPATEVPKPEHSPTSIPPVESPPPPPPKPREKPEVLPPALVGKIANGLVFLDQMENAGLVTLQDQAKISSAVNILRSEQRLLKKAADMETALELVVKTLQKAYQEEADRILANSNNFYNVFQVSADVSESDLKKRYRQLTRLFHDDNKVIDNPDLEVIKVINPAYETLSDPARRAKYDQLLRTAQAASVRYERGRGWQNAPFLDVLEQMITGQLDFMTMFPGIFGGQGNWETGTWPNASWPGGFGATASPEPAPKRDFTPLVEKLKFATTFTELHRLLVQLSNSALRFRLASGEELLAAQILNRIADLKKAIATSPDNDARIKAYVKTLKSLGAGLGKAIEQAVTNSLPAWEMLVSGQPAHIQLLRNAAGALMSDWDELGLLDEQGNQIMKFSRLHALLSELTTWEQTTDREAANHVYKLLLQLPTRFDLDLRVIEILKKNTHVNWIIPIDQQTRYEAYQQRKKQ